MESPRKNRDVEPAYAPIWPRLAERVQRAIADQAEDRSAAEALAAELLALELPARQRAIRGDARFQNLALVQELTRRGQAALPDDPPAARPPLGCALDLLRQLRPSTAAGLLANLRAEALGSLAESYLLSDDCDRAERALAKAAQALRDAPDLEAHGRFCERMARVRSRQGRLDEAVTLFTRATELAYAVGDLPRASQLQIQEGLLRRQLGENTTARALCELALLIQQRLKLESPVEEALRGGELQAALEILTGPAPEGDDLPWRETFLARLTEKVQADAFRTVGRVIEEHLAEFARYLPVETEAFPVTDLRAAAADLRYLQRYLAARGRAQFEDSGLTAQQSAHCLLASELALDLAPLLARLEAGLPGPRAG